EDPMRDETTRAALRLLRRGPLIVTGIAGMGKSWVVRRIASLIETNKAAAQPFTLAEIHDGARRDTAPRLAERLTLPDPRRLIIVDALDALASAASPVLDAIACYHGPLLLAAPPAIWEIAAGAPRFHAFLVSRCRSLVLSPLSPADRRALLFPA